MYNPDEENINNQVTQPYQPVSGQFTQPYREYQAYPAYPASQQNPPRQPYQSSSLGAENSYAAQGEKLTVRPQAQSQRNGNGSMRNPKKVAKLTKAQTLIIVSAFKKWLVVGSVLCFGVVTGLVITHPTGVTSQAATKNSTSTQQQATPAPATSGQGGFFQQPQQQGGYGFGNNGTSQAPVSGTSVS